MMKKILLALLLIATPLQAQTINNLGAGVAVSGTDQFPGYQGTNPAKRITATQIQNFTTPVGQLPGILNNTTANTGNVGEILTTSATGVALTNGFPKTITSASLTAGDWNVQCMVDYTTGTSTVIIKIITSSALVADNNNTINNARSSMIFGTGVTSTSDELQLNTPVTPYSFSTSTTVYCNGYGAFNTSSLTASGTILARRVR